MMALRAIAVIAVGGIFMVAGGCAHKAEVRVDDTKAFDYLEGLWSSKGGAREVTEEWMRVHPKLMLGSGQVVEGGELVSYEHLAIEVRDDGTYYVAHPKGQARTEFRLTRLKGRTEFENPDHDFPRRISYVRTEPTPGSALHIQAEGVEGGKPRKLDWSLALAGAERGPGKLTKRATVQASPAQIYRAFTTLAGVETFFAPAAKVDAKPWGAYEMYFVPDAPAGQRGGEGCRFVELVPNRRLAFTWNFPPSLPTIRDAHTLITVELKPLDGQPGRTDVILTQSGFMTGLEFAKGREYFDRAWGIVLDRLQKRFAHGPIDWKGLE